MKKNLLIASVLVLSILVFTSCGKTSTENEQDNVAEEHNKNVVEQIDEQLTGSWISYDADDFYCKWTFYNGNYVVESYLNGEKLDNPTIGTYFIGTESIHTITVDQQNNVEGAIPFTYKDGTLVLNGATGILEKIE